MRIKKTKVYPLAELQEDAKDRAIQNLVDINVSHEWWESTYEDAAMVSLKITAFDIGRGSYCHGEFIEYAVDAAIAIIKNHGDTCETHKTATAYIVESAVLNDRLPENVVDDYDENECEREHEQQALDDEFLHSILEDYRITLQKEYEYLTSEAAIIETIKANEYEFTADGVLA